MSLLTTWTWLHAALTLGAVLVTTCTLIRRRRRRRRSSPTTIIVSTPDDVPMRGKRLHAPLARLRATPLQEDSDHA